MNIFIIRKFIITNLFLFNLINFLYPVQPSDLYGKSKEGDTLNKSYFISNNNRQIRINNSWTKEYSKSGKNCISFENYSIKETLPIIKNCDLYIGNDTGWAHISCSLGVKSLTLFMDSPVMAYGKYSTRMKVIEPEGEKDSTTHDTLGKDKISFEKVLSNTLELLD